MVAAHLLRRHVDGGEEPRALPRGQALEARLPPARQHDRRAERHAAHAVRGVERVARILVPPPDGREREAWPEPGAGRGVEEERLEAAEYLPAVVQDDVVGEELQAVRGERGRERRLARAGEAGEQEPAPVERHARGVQRMRRATRLEVPPDRIVDRVVGEGAETAPAERRHVPPAQRALRRLAPAGGAEREVEAQLEAARRARRARDRDLGRVVAPEAEEAAGRGPHVAVDQDVGGPAGEDGFGRQRRPRPVGPAHAHRDVRRAARRVAVGELRRQVAREVVVLGLDLDRDARERDVPATHPTGCPPRAAAPSDRRRGRGWRAPTSRPAASRRRATAPAAR